MAVTCGFFQNVLNGVGAIWDIWVVDEGIVVMFAITFDGTRVVLREERWRHIVLRHPELKDKQDFVLVAVSNPDEVYVDSAGAFHVLKRFVGGVSDFLVVVYVKEHGEGYIRTAYYTSSRRKARRYRSFRRLRPS